MNTIRYIEEAKEKLGVSSDYAIAKKLGISRQAFSQYKHGERIIDDYTAAKLAEVLGVEPIEVIAAANAEREKDSAKVEFWRRLAGGRQAAGLAGVLILGAFLAGWWPQEGGESLYVLYIMRTDYEWALYVILAVLAGVLTYKVWRDHHATKGTL
jgi:transcriptional regulator with XRE-family HTH domain